jgi:hypothetical protein
MACYLVNQSTGGVVNRIVYDEASANGWQPPIGVVLINYDGPCDIGWIWDGSKAADPNPAPNPGTTTTL